jgi:hypothetical protein
MSERRQLMSDWSFATVWDDVALVYVGALPDEPLACSQPMSVYSGRFGDVTVTRDTAIVPALPSRADV